MRAVLVVDLYPLSLALSSGCPGKHDGLIQPDGQRFAKRM